jgi:hypothetical protein
MARKKFPSFDKLIEATDEIAVRLSLVEAPPIVAIAGGLAMQFYGSPRLTNDVDLIADSAEGLDWKKRLTFGGVRGEASNGVDVDVIVRDDEWADLYMGALVSAVSLEEAPIRVVPAEFMVVLKMIPKRDKDETDLIYLLQMKELNYDEVTRYVREYLGKFGVSELKSYRKQADWLKEKGE